MLIVDRSIPMLTAWGLARITRSLQLSNNTLNGEVRDWVLEIRRPHTDYIYLARSSKLEARSCDKARFVFEKYGTYSPGTQDKNDMDPVTTTDASHDHQYNCRLH
ncbi:hypothetical protein CHU98_g2516 [Xylaria longipes]|nr:hypothetical protein CHU98_g2516 [Xylaria longipes]